MKNMTAATIALMSLTACPSINSVDGLRGGTISGDSAVDGNLDITGDVTSAASSMDTLVTKDATVSGILRVTTEAEISRLVATTAQLNTIDTQIVPKVKGKALLPSIVGVAARPNTSGATAAEASCFAAFAGSHICREAELDLALRFYEGDISSLDGVSFQVAPRVASQLIRDVDGVDVRLPFIIDNCQDWNALADIPNGAFPTPRRTLVGTIDVDEGISGRAVLRIEGTRVLTDYSSECAKDTVEFVCCQ